MATNVPNTTGSFGSIYTVGPQGSAGVNNSTWTVTGAAAGTPGIWTTGATGPTGSNWGIYDTANTYSNDIILRRSGKQDIRVGDTLEMLMDRLCIIQPALELIEKYPALKEAYENYKLIETMVMNGEDENELG